MKRALIVDDSQEARDTLALMCKNLGVEVRVLSSGEQLLKLLPGLDNVHVVLLDLLMPRIDGFEVLTRIRAVNSEIPVIVITGMDDGAMAERCLALGATDFISKPVEPARLRASLLNALRTRELSEEVTRLADALGSLPGVSGIAGHSRAFQQTLDLVARVKDSDATVLILGESGVGKEVIARTLHFQGSRRDEPFVAVNCAAIPESLLESELFGHEAGAFTGANRMHKGKFEAAGRGTVFLDEIGEMSPGSQTRLLRVLQERKVVRVGGVEEVPVQARVVCATNKNLKALVRDGAFREDLYYRINAFPISVPPLRERPEDVPPLAEHFLRRYAEQEGKKISGFEPDAMSALEACHWPGNVRQLEHAIERAVLLADGERITLDMLPDDVQQCVRSTVNLRDYGRDRTDYVTVKVDGDSPRVVAAATSNPGNSGPGNTITGAIVFATCDDVVPMDRVERACILAALRACEGDVEEAARRLGISRATLYRRLRRYGVTAAGQVGP